MELGPCTIADPSHVNGTKVNPHSWNNNANVIFLEQPIGVSFSYGKHGQTTSTTEEAAVDVQAFVSIFFQTFKEFKGREYFMSGESYGGRYLPVFASAILDGNKDLVAKGLDPVNLKGVLIGNGITDACESRHSDALPTWLIYRSIQTE
jgi:cathepsin A (carboxypeptidase C)